ncbi:MAG TPA: zinc-ribbon domain-containing protein [Syntrophales bacterium]
MVAQCKNCQTKFKFDETLIEGEGIWVRCNQCKNVFFLDNPKEAGETSLSNRKKDMGAEDMKESASEYKIAAQGQIMLDEEEGRERPKAVTAGEIEKEVGDIGKFKSVGTENVHDNRPDRDIAEEKAGLKPVTSHGRQVIYLLIVLLIGGVYFTFFTEIDWQTSYEKIFGMTKRSEDVGPAQVDLTDVRQRLVSNMTMGTIRVLEGTAINRSAFPMTRIKVKGEITDAYTVVLGVKESSCGNLLNADELATMTEDQIQKELSNPQGSDVSNDRVVPQGRIPFMIVFTREPAGVVKAFAMPVGAERLLP